MTAQEFGERIRICREAKDLTIADVAARFKLSVTIVRGIEEGSLDRMPHVVYAKGFIRAYAQAVEVPQEDLAAGLAALFPDELFAEVPTVPGPVSAQANKNPVRYGRILAPLCVLAVLALLCGGGWYIITTYGEDLYDRLVRPVTEIFSSAAPVQDEGRAAPSPGRPALGVEVGRAAASSAPAAPLAGSSRALPTESSLAPAALAAPSGTPGPAASVLPSASPSPVSAPASTPLSSTAGMTASAPGSVGSPAARNTAPEAERQAAGQAAEAPVMSGKHVTLAATQECWVQVMADGDVSRSFTMTPGETSILPYKAKLTLVLGNSAGVDITHNGKVVSQTGRRGEKKTLLFQ